MKKCPYCFEEIQDSAIKCKHCGEMLNRAGSPGPGGKGTGKQLTRSRSDTMISGVCGGLGKYLDMDSTLVRLLVVVVGLTTGFFPVLIGYLVMALMVPEGE